MTLIVLGEAEEEFAQSVQYYESKEVGLGAQFRDEVVEAVERIVTNPELLRLRPKGYRRVNLRAFPHYIAYVIRGETIWIIAIAHGHRRPSFGSAGFNSINANKSAEEVFRSAAIYESPRGFQPRHSSRMILQQANPID